MKKRFDIVRRVSSKFFELKLWSCSRRCSNIDFHPVTVWERSGILSHMFWWFWIHENWKFSLFCRKYMKSCLAELGVDQIGGSLWPFDADVGYIMVIDAAGRVYHLRRSQSLQAVHMTWWTCGEFFYSLCGVKDLNWSFRPNQRVPARILDQLVSSHESFKIWLHSATTNLHCANPCRILPCSLCICCKWQDGKSDK